MATPMISITFVRHGESTDNLRSVWAGWEDAPLSNHGMNQARAVGQSLSSTPFTAIHASDLKRAFTTAQAIYDAQPAPKPAFDSSPLLREQHFGVAEGKPWALHTEPGLSLEEHYARGIYPVLFNRAEAFPGGESLDDLAKRAEEAVGRLVMPHVWEAARKGKRGVHVALVSHGLCISELIAALMRKNAGGGGSADKYKGLLNTAWTRVAIDVQGVKEGEPLEFPDDDPPPLTIKVTDINRHEHIDNIVRQGGGIGRQAYDPKQADIRAFFGGAAVGEHSASNARDETVTPDETK
ncbi:phosphoglycerate mutase-like protein [Gloeophyllum trabeum ATCC 11539]|uniref:Phosphoglycerate mutase-like protein n=1 Tax=Gloeophyllum trabeum (strain ATCC 11539 / FP-39264 / Madison 617) TaxID=670483 RepID=S7Q344_GLOTA|nr:phosphoglycerate mutase-like protein [Gloeophyllum trabeum ATCC 11539]EPQ54431.1 phosphoglycerate mutase-like protein [Gloeophyllum trabeum ATCC 11539]